MAKNKTEKISDAPAVEKLNTETTATEKSAAELNSEIVLPTPNERTIAALAEDDATPGETATAPAVPDAPTAQRIPASVDLSQLDNNGDKFDASVHAPEKTKHGYWKRLKPKPYGTKRTPTATAPASNPAPSPSVVGGIPGESGPAFAPIGDRYDMAAEVYSRAFYSVSDGLMAGGGEWLPENDGEHIALRGSMAAYMRHKGMDDLPPGLAFALAMATYAGKRVSKPNTQTRLRLFAQWAKARWGAWRHGRRIENLPDPVPVAESEKRPLAPGPAVPDGSTSATVPHS